MKRKLIITSVIFFVIVIAMFVASRFIDFNAILGNASIPVFLTIQILSTVLLCFVPATSMTFIIIAVSLYGPTWQCFVICFSGVIISSIIMDLIGRFGGSKLICKLIGENAYNEALQLLKIKGTVYIPVMYLLPVFPDDAICMAAGACKVPWWIHYIEIILCRGIGCATIVFGISILPLSFPSSWQFFIDNLWNYIVEVTVIVTWVIIMLYIARRIDKWLTERRKRNANENDNNTTNGKQS